MNSITKPTASQRSTISPRWLAIMAVVLVVASLAPTVLLLSTRL